MPTYRNHPAEHDDHPIRRNTTHFKFSQVHRLRLYPPFWAGATNLAKLDKGGGKGKEKRESRHCGPSLPRTGVQQTRRAPRISHHYQYGMVLPRWQRRRCLAPPSIAMRGSEPFIFTSSLDIHHWHWQSVINDSSSRHHDRPNHHILYHMVYGPRSRYG